MKKGWEVKKLSEIGKIFNGNSINARVKNDKYTGISNGLSFIATKDVGFDSVIDYENGVRIPEEEIDKFKIAPPNTPLICAEGGSAGRKIGFTNQNVCFGNKLFALLPNKNVDNKFLYYFFFSSIFQHYFSVAMAGLIGGVSMNKFKNIEIFLPPLPEQKRIVTILDITSAVIDKAKANAEKNLANAKELFESCLFETFSNLKENYENVKLISLCSKITDGVHKKPNYVKAGIPFIKINNLTNGSGISFANVSYISKEDHDLFSKRTNPEKGDILITKDGTIGIVRLVETEITFSIFVSVALIKPKNKDSSQYLKYVLTSPQIQSQIKPKGTALKHLYLKDLREYIIPVPSIKIQTEIVSKLDRISNEISQLEKNYKTKLSLFEELKKSLLKKAFEGEL